MVLVARALAASLGRYAVSVAQVDAQLKAMVRCINCPGGPWWVATKALLKKGTLR
jgi:hypothetical protein